MVRFPNWLPRRVANYITEQLAGNRLDKDSRARLIRLCTALDMKNAWRTLQRAAPDETHLVEFLGFVLREPRFLPNSREPAPSPAKLRKSFEKIAKLAASLVQELQQLGGENNPTSGMEELLSALLRIAHSPREQLGAEEELSANKITTTALSLYECLGDNPDQPSLSEYLSYLDEAAIARTRRAH